MWAVLLLSITGAWCVNIPVAECDIGSYKICFFASLQKIGAASDNADKLEAVVPKTLTANIQASLPAFISYWIRSPKLVIVDDAKFRYPTNNTALTVVIDSPSHMSHSLQHAAATFSLMNSGRHLMPFSTAVKRVINVHPSHAEWANNHWAKFWWSFVDAAPSIHSSDLHNVDNVVVMQSVGPPFQNGNFFFSKIDAFDFRRRIYNRANIPLTPPSRKLDQYTVCIASRTETRRIANLAELIAELNNNTYAITITTTVIPNPGITYKNNPLELAKIMSTCDVYVAVLASELVFQMFMREKTSTLEIMPPKWLDYWHNELAYTLGINWVPVYSLHETKDDDYITWYGCQMQETVTHSCSFERFHNVKDITVHVKSLVKQIVRQLLKIIPH